MKIEIPRLSLVVLVGISGSGKSTFAARHFLPTQVLSSDFCRGLVSDDENSLAATPDAFDVLYYIARKRLAAGRLTVIDATNVRTEDRRRLVQLARDYHCLPTAIVLNPPEQVCLERNRERDDRNFGSKVLRSQLGQLKRGLKQLKREGFRHVRVLRTVEEIESVEIELVPLWNDRRYDHGPFDIIGDIHGCFDELLELVERLGYHVEQDPARPRGDWDVTAPETGGVPRKLVFLGDLVDRGPGIVPVLRLVMRLVAEGKALCVPGNHEIKLMRKLNGRDIQVKHGLADSLEQLAAEPEGFSAAVAEFIDGLVSHYVLDDGGLVTAHAGLKEEMQGRGSGAVREFCLFGETTGETDEFGLPVRYNWARDYRGRALVAYGHTPVPRAEWLNNTINLDTGCVFGGELTALRYPERELVAVPARAVHAAPARPIDFTEQAEDGMSAQQEQDELLDYADVAGKRVIETSLDPRVQVTAEQAAAALEQVSRFAVDPRWLVYLPPTMSPSATSDLPDRLEHPAEAFAYYRTRGVEQAVCEEKHMGSRAVVVLCRDADAARRRFGIATGEPGVCYTRTGRRFFDDPGLEREFLATLTARLEGNGFFDKHETDWVCLDCELMPWSFKAQLLLSRQYALVGSTAQASLARAVAALGQAVDSAEDAGLRGLLDRYRERGTAVDRYRAAYRRYCWPVESLADIRLAPFHVLAWEGAVHHDRDHRWHLETIAAMFGEGDGLLRLTNHRFVVLNDEQSCAEATAWWEELTAGGGEGMVVKPLDFIARGRRGLLQPAVKCRGAEYLRIIYGPEYLLPENLRRLRERSLRRKSALALREFALGLEGLERFVRREPLRRVHECAFAVLALECEPVDPRL